METINSTYLLVDIIDELVQIFKPVMSCLVVEVISHCHHQMVGRIMVRLTKTSKRLR